MTAFKAGLIQTNVSNEVAENVAFGDPKPDLDKFNGTAYKGGTPVG